MVVWYFEQKIRQNLLLLVNDNLKKKPASGAAASQGMPNGKGKGNIGDCLQWTTKGQCSRGDKCGMKRDPENVSENPKGKDRVRDRPALQEETLWVEAARQEKSFSE